MAEGLQLWLGAAREGASAGFARHPAASISGQDAGLIEAALAVPGRAFRIGGRGAVATGAGGFETLTSGSSGEPRRIMRSMASWCTSFAVNRAAFAVGPGTGVAVLGRLDQSLALYAAVEGLCLGADVRLLSALRPDRQRAALEGAEVLYATPAQVRLVLDAAGPAALPALRQIVIGGARLDPVVKAQVLDLAPAARLTEFYGAAETSFITWTDGASPEGAVGRAYPGVEIRVEAPQGEVGEIWVRSPYLFQGYAGTDPGSARWRGDWLSVGEMGALRDGNLFLAGRAGRMVTVADQNVFPEEIEAFLMTQPGIRQAAVLARAEAKRGAVLVAVMQGDAGREAEIARALRDRLGPTRAPKALIWRADWPLLPSGKTDLRRLQAEHAP